MWIDNCHHEGPFWRVHGRACLKPALKQDLDVFQGCRQGSSGVNTAMKGAFLTCDSMVLTTESRTVGCPPQCAARGSTALDGRPCSFIRAAVTAWGAAQWKGAPVRSKISSHFKPVFHPRALETWSQPFGRSTTRAIPKKQTAARPARPRLALNHKMCGVTGHRIRAH